MVIGFSGKGQGRGEDVFAMDSMQASVQSGMGGIYLSLAGDIFFAIAIVKIRHAELFLLLINSP